jgi:hypothetical protein
MNHFTTELLPADSSSSKRIRDLWEEYEAGQSAEARFVKDLDRFELGLQAVEYEQGRSILLRRRLAIERPGCDRAQLGPPRVLGLDPAQDRITRSEAVVRRSVGSASWCFRLDSSSSQAQSAVEGKRSPSRVDTVRCPLYCRASLTLLQRHKLRLERFVYLSKGPIAGCRYRLYARICFNSML